MIALRDLPAIDRLLNTPELSATIARYGLGRVKQSLRDLQQSWRNSGAPPVWAADPTCYVAHLERELRCDEYTSVFNLTGTIIHTNLGRALLSPETYQAVEPLVTRPMNLEFDIDAGHRGDRDKIVEDKLKLLTGAEAATVVNNGAAALMLVLNTFALGKTVPVSRGELIEIGGSFRLPDIMTRSGCELREVGTTNRTHLRDYENAIDASTGLLLKVHPSNYHINGFTTEVGAPQLADLGHERQLPVCVDLGSGSLVDLRRWGLPYETTVQQVLGQGVDLVTFSGDKLLGALQAGIIVGRKDLLDALKRNPMKRALRADKLTLAFLGRTLADYEDPESLPDKLPLLKTLTTGVAELAERARRVQAILEPVLDGFDVTVSNSRCQIGSGSLPGQNLGSISVKVSGASDTAVRDLQTTLRGLPVPVIGRLNQGELWLDMRCAVPLEELCANLQQLAP